MLGDGFQSIVKQAGPHCFWRISSQLQSEKKNELDVILSNNNSLQYITLNYILLHTLLSELLVDQEDFNTIIGDIIKLSV